MSSRAMARDEREPVDVMSLFPIYTMFAQRIAVLIVMMM